MNVIIIEDEELLQQRLTRILKNINAQANIIKILSTVKESIHFFENNKIPIDLILSDIQLGDGTSFKIFEKIKIIYPIIFITSHEKYLLKAFEVNTIDYLLKPVKQEELEKSINKMTALKDFNNAKVDQFIQTILSAYPEAERNKDNRNGFLVKLKKIFAIKRN
ncbi:hypothetical protein BH09BAC2_BH09BAC2_16350 [soil metagenome]